jgi:amino acid transporter
MHTGSKSRGEGCSNFLPKSLGGSKLSRPGGSPILSFIAFLLICLLKFVWGPCLLSPFPLSPPPCASMVQALISIVSVATGMCVSVHCTMYEAAFVAFVWNHLQKVFPPTGSSKEISTRYSESLVSLNNEKQMSLSIEIT